MPINYKVNVLFFHWDLDFIASHPDIIRQRLLKETKDQFIDRFPSKQLMITYPLLDLLGTKYAHDNFLNASLVVFHLERCHWSVDENLFLLRQFQFNVRFQAAEQEWRQNLEARPFYQNDALKNCLTYPMQFRQHLTFFFLLRQVGDSASIQNTFVDRFDTEQ